MTTLRKLNVSGGEIAPALYPRTDTAKFQAGFRTLRNMYVRKDGSLENRQGGEMRGHTRADGKVYVAEFRVTGEPSFQIEFSHQKIRILRQGKPEPEPGFGDVIIQSVTQANPAVVTYGGLDKLMDGDEITFHGNPLSGMPQLLNRSFVVANIDLVANTFELNDEDGAPIDSTTFTAYQNNSFYATKNMILDAPYSLDHIAFIDHDQSVDVLYIVHPMYEPMKLSRTLTDWYLDPIPFSVVPPLLLSGLNISAFGAGSGNTGNVYYAVTAVTPQGEETIDANATAVANLSPTATYFNQLGWKPDAAGITYHIYRRVDGIYGLIGSVVSTASGYQANMYRDVGVVPDTTNSIANYYNPFDGPGNYPSAVCFFQQRVIYANTINKPETVFASKVGVYNQFMKRTPGDPIRDDDSIEFSLAGRSINPVQYLMDLNGLVMMTESSEQYLGNEAMTPSTIQPQAQSYNGSRKIVRPIPINSTMLYLQAMGSVIRELGYDYQIDGYRGDDLTTFSTHLFKNRTIVSWSYQQIPNSILWVVRDDGALLSLTHVKEQQILAWARHDVQGGFVENVISCREEKEDVIYLVVRRMVNGKEMRLYERLPSREINSLNDCRFLDSYYEYNGENDDQFTTMTLTDGDPAWDYETLMTLSCNQQRFYAAMVDQEIHLRHEGEIIRAKIVSYDSPFSVKVYPHKTVPVSMRNTPIHTWGHAIKELKGLTTLEGKKVSAFADGNVVASANNSDVAFTVEVTEGVAALDKCYVNIAVGMPITADLETLDIDTINGETMVDKAKLISRITLEVEESRGFFAGYTAPLGSDYLLNLNEVRPRFDENYESPNRLITGKMDVNIEPRWNSNGRVFVRQVDPLPLAVLSISPSGLIPFRG